MVDKQDQQQPESQPITERKLLEQIHDKLVELTQQMHRMHIADYLILLNRPFRLIIPNIISGISRGIGIAIGITIFTGTIIYILELLGALELPVIGDYISSLVRYVQKELERR